MSIQNARMYIKTFRETFQDWIVQKLNEPFAQALPIPLWMALLICVFSSIVSAIVSLLLLG